MAEGGLGAYAYCIIADDAQPALDGVTGVDPGLSGSDTTEPYEVQ